MHIGNLELERFVSSRYESCIANWEEVGWIPNQEISTKVLGDGKIPQRKSNEAMLLSEAAETCF